jgi:hypothetical protein
VIEGVAARLAVQEEEWDGRLLILTLFRRSETAFAVAQGDTLCDR